MKYIELFAEIAATMTGRDQETILSEMVAYEKHLEHKPVLQREVSPDDADKLRSAAKADRAGFLRMLSRGMDEVAKTFFKA